MKNDIACECGDFDKVDMFEVELGGCFLCTIGWIADVGKVVCFEFGIELFVLNFLKDNETCNGTNWKISSICRNV